MLPWVVCWGKHILGWLNWPAMKSPNWKTQVTSWLAGGKNVMWPLAMAGSGQLHIHEQKCDVIAGRNFGSLYLAWISCTCAGTVETQLKKPVLRTGSHTTSSARNLQDEFVGQFRTQFSSSLLGIWPKNTFLGTESCNTSSLRFCTSTWFKFYLKRLQR